MKEEASWSMPPRRRAIVIVNAGLDAFCSINGFSPLDSKRIQVCVEGVFIYCVNNIHALSGREEIRVRLFWEDRKLKILIQHDGPKGEWDESLKVREFPIRRTSFEAMGLFIAKEILSSLTYESLFDVVSGQVINTYELVYQLDYEASAHRKVGGKLDHGKSKG
ncbi:MAG: hypothetical protein JEY79_08870 [Pseudodesulfovibrio sp.]|nr:hypothetical protein [Pseudodesulfovibrio sp.]